MLLLCTLTNTITAEKLMSPIVNLEPSFAASVAHSTTVAVCHDDCVVVLTRSGKAKSNNPLWMVESETAKQNNANTKDDASRNDETVQGPNSPDGDEQTFIQYGIKLQRTDSSAATSRLSVPRTRRVGRTCLSSMTGFAADIVHLQSVLDKQVETHRAIYNLDQPFRTTTAFLARTLENTAFQLGARPYGIQAMLIGLGPTEQQQQEQQQCHWTICLCDATGTARYFRGGAVCIGRHAAAIQRELVRQTKARMADTGTSTAVSDVEQSIGMAVAAIRKIFKEAREKQGADHEDFEGLLVWKNKGRLQTAPIDVDYLASIIGQQE